MGLFAGCDVGSTTGKAVVLVGDRVAASAILPSTIDPERTAREALEAALGKLDGAPGIDGLDRLVGTGYGRVNLDVVDDTITEITCHGKGANYFYGPSVRTVLDMGGQDTKAIRIEPGGDVLDFCMNDKCAAGTGRFLQSAAAALGLELDELGPRAQEGRRPVSISTTCTVFAESEVLSWLARGRKIEDILLGVHGSIGKRSFGLLKRVGIDEEVTFTGGVTSLGLAEGGVAIPWARICQSLICRLIHTQIRSSIVKVVEVTIAQPPPSSQDIAL